MATDQNPMTSETTKTLAERIADSWKDKPRLIMACTCGSGQECQPLKPGCWGYQLTPTPRPFKELADAMSPESRARADAKAAALSTTTLATGSKPTDHMWMYDFGADDAKNMCYRCNLSRSEAPAILGQYLPCAGGYSTHLNEGSAHEF